MQTISFALSVHSTLPDRIHHAKNYLHLRTQFFDFDGGRLVRRVYQTRIQRLLDCVFKTLPEKQRVGNLCLRNNDEPSSLGDMWYIDAHYQDKQGNDALWVQSKTERDERTYAEKTGGRQDRCQSN